MTKDSRLYGKFTLDFPHHPKVFILTDKAFRMLVEMTLLSRQMLTDGRIPQRLAHARWSAEAAEELLTNDAEKPSIFIDGDDYIIHDFADHQTTTEDLNKRREAGRKGGIAKAKNTKKATTKAPKNTDPSKSLASASHLLSTSQSLLDNARPSLARSNEKTGENTPQNHENTPPNNQNTPQETPAQPTNPSKWLASAKQMPSKKLPETETETIIKKEEKKIPPLLQNLPQTTQNNPTQPEPAPPFDPHQWTTPDNPRCPKHHTLPPGAEPRCTNCKKTREFFQAEHHQRTTAEQHRRATQIAQCPHCDERGFKTITKPDGSPAVTKCDHTGHTPQPEAPQPPKPQWTPNTQWREQIPGKHHRPTTNQPTTPHQ